MVLQGRGNDYLAAGDSQIARDLASGTRVEGIVALQLAPCLLALRVAPKPRVQPLLTAPSRRDGSQ